MHPPITPRPRRGARAAALAALVLAASACSDRGATAPDVVDPPTPPALGSALLTCRANVRLATLECAPPDGPATASTARYGRIVGGQGTFVRLTSSGVSYAGGVFSFNLTVQNLLTVAMATTDGATRHAEGVRVFFHAGPSVTDGTGEITVSNPSGMETFTGANQPFYQYGGTLGGVDGTELGADGILATAEVSAAKSWQLAMPATVNTFSFTLLVTTETAGNSAVSAAPQVSAVSPNPLVPGATATLTGTNFSATPASNTVTIGGVAATVTAATATSLTVTVPCVSSGTPAVQVTTGGMKGAAANAPLQVAQRTVPVGEALVLTSSAESACNELASANGAARYLVAVFSASTTPGSNAPYVLTADGADGEAAPALRRSPAGLPDVLTGTAPAPAALGLDGHMDAARQRASDARHMDLLEKNRRAYEQLRTEFPRGRAPRGARLNRNVVYGDPPLSRTFRVSNISPPAGQTICSSFYVVNATRVYFDGKLAIYEDDATPDAFKSSLNATMADYYDRIGDQFNADMEPVVRDNFGDILRRDAETDANGVEVALFTPRLNTSFAGVAGFVVSCDQFPNNDTTTSYTAGGPYTGLSSGGGTASNGASNFGEYFYAYQPVTNAAGYSGNTPDNWYRTIRSTFIHESKHVASQAARVANNAPSYEASWLEEGTARHSEELWMRNAVDNVAWKANTGYGSAANPINLYCDVRPSGFPECLTNSRRPVSIMQRHFTSLYTNMFGTNARLLSPFGATASDNASYWYATSWSLVRYAIDRYGASDAAFLSGLNESTTSGVTNLTAQAGVSIDQLLGGWALSLAADDHPLLASPPHADVQMPTWNFRSIYAGLNADFPATYTLPYPLVPTALGFGTFAPPAITTLRGGGVLWYEISGTQTAPQLLRLQGSGGSAIPSTLRLAVTRIQ